MTNIFGRSLAQPTLQTVAHAPRATYVPILSRSLARPTLQTVAHAPRATYVPFFKTICYNYKRKEAIDLLIDDFNTSFRMMGIRLTFAVSLFHFCVCPCKVYPCYWQNVDSHGNINRVPPTPSLPNFSWSIPPQASFIRGGTYHSFDLLSCYEGVITPFAQPN